MDITKASRRSLLVVLSLIVVIVASVFVAAEFSFIHQSWRADSGPFFTGEPLRRPLEGLAHSLRTADGKIILIEEGPLSGYFHSSTINCFDSQNGKSIWNCTEFPWLEGRYLASAFEVSDNRVYFAFSDNHGNQIACLNASTGTALWTQAGDAGGMMIKDGRLYASKSARNATTGELLWETAYPWIRPPNATNWLNGWAKGIPLNGNPYDGCYVYGAGYDDSTMYLFKLDTDNGQVVWLKNFPYNVQFSFMFPDTALPSVLAVTEQQVILCEPSGPNYSSNAELFCLNPNTGDKVWSISPSTGVYEPKVYNDLLLYTGLDGYYYALHLSDGNVAWKTKVDTQGILAYREPERGITASPISQVDVVNRQAIWYVAAKNHDDSGNSTGTLCSLDLTDGKVQWSKQIENGWAADSASFVVNHGEIFLNANNTLWMFSELTGDLIGSQKFENHLSIPVTLGNKTFVSGDLWLYSYGS